MNKKLLYILTICIGLCFGFQNSSAQSFDFEKLQDVINDVAVVIELKVSYSFGAHSNDQDEKYLGTVVSEDGLVLFNGITLGSESPISALAGMNVKTTPTEIKVRFLDDTEYEADFIGVDRFSNIGFIKIKAEDKKFKAIQFKQK